MNGEEPYRWLEAIRNRREYIEDQMQGGMAVACISGAPGILLMTHHASTPKLFEIYDHLALGCLGHPADMEKVRQAAIDTAHIEGFARSRNDVSSRRLVNYSLGPALKTAFEQIFQAPLMFRGILGELGSTPEKDMLWTMEYDGSYLASRPMEAAQGVLVTGRKRSQQTWTNLKEKTAPNGSGWKPLALQCLRSLAWMQMLEKSEQKAAWDDTPKSVSDLMSHFPDGLECAVLDRGLAANTIAYRAISNEELGIG
jgi:proteasome alpha subunit